MRRPGPPTARRALRRLIESGLAVAAIGLVVGCGADHPVYQVGDCLKTSVNEDGAAEKTGCSDPASFEVTKLAKNGGMPSCPYYVGEDSTSSGAAYLTDALTDVTYCGRHNRPY